MDMLMDREKVEWLSTNRYFAIRIRECDTVSPLLDILRELSVLDEETRNKFLPIQQGEYKDCLQETIGLGDVLIWTELANWKLKQLRIIDEQSSLSTAETG